MRRAALASLLALGGLLACAEKGTRVEQLEGANPGAFRRVAVVPFSDSRGQGWLMAAKVNQGLSGLGFNTVDLHQVETVFSSLKLDFSSALSIHSLAEIRHATLAEALIFGSVDSSWREATLLMIETEMGDMVLSAKLKPRRGPAFRTPEEVAAEALRAISLASGAAPRRGGASSLPEPQ